MKQKTFYSNKQKIFETIEKTSINLLENYSKINSTYNTKGYFVDKNSFHFISELLIPKNKAEQTFYNIMMDNIIKTEKFSGNSVEISFLFSCLLMKNLIKNYSLIENINSNDLKNTFESYMDYIKTNIQENIQIANNENLNTQIENHINDVILSNVVRETLKLAGFDGKIYIEDSKQSNFIIEKQNGFSFNGLPFKFFLTQTNTTWEKQNCKVLLIDGMLEKVSEIDQLLNKAIEFQQPFAIFARGFSEEVIATLKLNYDKKVFDVIPVKINSDLESLNMLNDIGAVTNSSVVSALTGDLLSLIKWDELKNVKKIRCSLGNVTIEEDKNIGVVNQQVVSLLEKRMNNINIDDIVSLIDKRIKALTNSAVTIYLPNVSNIENNTIRAKLDTTLRLCKTVVNNGIINYDEFVKSLEKPSNTTELIIYNSLIEMSSLLTTKQIPSLSLYLSLKILGGICFSIISSNGMINLED
jgi:hypothetical protein